MTQAVDKMSTAFDKLRTSLGKTRGTSAIKELQAVVAGVDALQAAVRETQDGTITALSKLVAKIDDLPRAFADALGDSRRVLRDAGTKLGSAAGEGMAEGLEKGSQKFKTTWAKQKTENQKLYEEAQKAGVAIQDEQLRQMQLFGVQMVKLDRERLTELALQGKQAIVLDKEATANMAKELRNRLNTVKAGNALIDQEMKEAAARRVTANAVFAKIASPLANLSAEGSAGVFEAELAKREKVATELRIQGLNARIKAGQEANMRRLADEAAAEKASIGLTLQTLNQQIRDRQEAHARRQAAEAEAHRQSESLKAKWAKAYNAISKVAYDKEVAEAQDAAKRIQEAQRSAARVQVTQAMSKPGGSYSVYTPTGKDHGALRDFNTELDKTPGAAGRASKGLQNLGVDANTTHSAMRGLASGFGLLWLTWGNLAPLLTGAAISNGFVQTIKLGSQVTSTFDAIRVLSEESTASVAKLEGQMLSLAKTGPFGLDEISKAMKTLSLAGLSAAEIGSSIRDVLNFAVAGDTTIEKAADVITSVATAFKYTATQYNIVGDVIAKTAAISKSSVESIGEAFKTASVLSAQYGASLTDVGVGLAALSNLGIQGSAAGTALRNMYVDLSGRSKEVTKLMKELGLEIREVDSGGFPNIISMMKQLEEALNKAADPIDKAKLTQKLLSERGSKPIIEMLQLMRSEAEITGTTVTNELEKMEYRLKNAAGFSAIAAAEMSLSATNQIKSVFSTLQVTAYEAFKEIQPLILDATTALKEMFSSQEFKTGFTNMIVNIGTLTKLLVENLDVIAKLALAYVAFKTALVMGGVLSSIAVGFSGLATAITAAGGAAGIGSIAMAAFARVMTPVPGLLVATSGAALAGGGAMAAFAGGAARLLGLLAGPIGLAITAAVAAWQLYGFFTEKATTANDQFSGASSKALTSALDEQITLLREKNAALLQGITLEEYQTKQKNVASEQEAALASTKALVKAKEDLAKADADVARLEAGQDPAAAGSGQKFLRQEALKAAQWRAQQRVSDIQAAKDSAEQQVNIKKAQLLKEAQIFSVNTEYDRQQKEKARQAAEKALLGGNKTVLDETAKMEKVARDNSLSNIESRYRKEAELAKSSGDMRMRMLEDLRRNELMSEGEYVAKSLALTQAEEAKRLDITTKAQQAYNSEMATAALKLRGQFKGGALDQELENLTEKWVTFTASIDADRTSVANTALERQAKAANLAAGGMAKMQREFDDFWAKDAERKDAKTRVEGLEEDLDRTGKANKAFTAAFEAEYKVYETRIISLQTLLRDTAKSAGDFANQMAAAGSVTVSQAVGEGITPLDISPEATARLNDYQQRLAAITAELEKLKAAAASSAASSGNLAVIKDFLSKDLGDNLSKGFDRAGKAMAGLINAYRKLGEVQTEQAAANKANLDENAKDADKFAATQKAIAEKGAKAQVASYGNMVSAAKMFFKEGSKGYKALEAAEKVFRAFELAMSIKSMAQKLFEVETVTVAKVAGDVASATSASASAGVQVAANSALSASNAVVAVTNQGKGDPYTAFARIAAMTALMAGLGVALSGGGGSKDPGNTGTGTVFGDSSAPGAGMEDTRAKSESLTKGIDILANNSEIGLRYSQGMLAALNNIAANISGLTNIVLRTTGATTGSGFNVATGYDSVFSGIPVVGDLLSKLFGSKTSITGTGLYQGNQTLGGAMTNGVDLRTYIDTQVKDKFLGLTYNTSNQSQYAQASSELSDQFGKILAGFSEAIQLAAVPLGANLDSVKSKLDSFVLDIGKIDLQGLTGTQINEKLTAVFGALGDNIAKSAIPGLDAFQKAGEGYIETVIRVANAVESARAGLGQLGIAMVDYNTLKQKQGDVELELVRASILKVEKLYETSMPDPSKAGQMGPFAPLITEFYTGVGDILKMFSGSAGELIDLYKTLQGMRDGLKAVGVNAAGLTAVMIQAAGGLDGLQDGLDSYFSEYLTKGEQATELTRRMTVAFANISVPMPTTIQGFKDLVKGIDVTTEAGQSLFGKIISLSGGFSEMVKAVEEASAVTEASNKAAEERSSLLEKLATAQDEYNKLTMTSAEYLALQKSKLESSNFALFDQVEAINAQIEAVNAAKAVESERKSLQDQLNQLTMTSAQLLGIQRDALSESNRQLFDQIQAAKRAVEVENERKGLQDQLNQLTMTSAQLLELQRAALDSSNQGLFDMVQAAQAAANALQAAAAKAAAIATERYSLETQLLQLQGNTVELRARELEKLDPANRELQKTIWALEDKIEADKLAQQAADEAARAAEAAAAAAQRLKDAWQDVANSIMDEIRRIRGELPGGKTLAGAQSALAIAQAQAKAGDIEAAKSLPALSQALLQLAAAQAKSAVDLARFQGTTAASLEETLRVIAAQRGLTIPGFASGGDHMGGMRIVGEHGPELEVTGRARIYNAQQTRDVLSGQSNAELAAEVRALKQVVVELALQLQASQGAIAVNTAKTAKILTNITPEGDAVRIRVPTGESLPTKEVV